MPAADRLRPNEQTLPAIARKRLCESAKHDSVGQRATRPGDLPTKHRQLVAQHEDLNRVSVLRSTTKDEQFHEAPEHPVKDGSDHQPIVPAATRATPHPSFRHPQGQGIDYTIAYDGGGVVVDLCKILFGGDGSYYLTAPYHPVD